MYIVVVLQILYNYFTRFERAVIKKNMKQMHSDEAMAKYTTKDRHGGKGQKAAIASSLKGNR
jgi:hypothetical protein